MHAEYESAWKKNPPPNQSHPMRLMEFIFSHCNGENCSDSNDSIDIALKKARDKMGIRTKDLFEKLDAKHEVDRANKIKEFEKRIEYDDNTSSFSKISSKSLVGSIVPLKDSTIKDILNDDDSSLSSQSSHSTTSYVNTSNQSVTNNSALNTNNNPSPIKDITPYGIVSISNQLHIPDNFSTLYYSLESDDVKKTLTIQWLSH